MLSGKNIFSILWRLVHGAAFIGLLALFCFWQNNSLVVSRHTFANEKIPPAFDGFTILHLSDLHNKSFGANQSSLLRKIQKIHPDLVVITGDLIDRRRYNAKPAMDLVERLTSLVPVYYVPGNHEAWSGKYQELRDQLIKAGVTVLDNASVRYTLGQDSIEVLGVRDPGFLSSQHPKGTDTQEMEEFLSSESFQEDFTILLSHRPELMELYKKYPIELVLSGHAHGGQIRIPYIGGLFAPNQGLLPRYDAGMYEENGTTLLVSRGLGNSLFPLRLFNRPELVVITLQSAQ